MKTTKLLAFVALVALAAYPQLASAQAGGPPGDWGAAQDVPGDQYRGSLAPGEPHTFRFRQRAQLRFNSNAPLELDVNVDANNVDADFALDLNCPDGVPAALTVAAEESRAEFGLQQGKMVQTRSQHRYAFRSGFTFNATLNVTCGNAKLYLYVGGNPNAAWARYDEGSGEWEVLDTTLEGDYATTVVEHFSTYAVLELEEETTIGSPATWFGLIGGAGLAVAALARKFRARR
ncbi:MAG: hypothetical protein Kow0069_07720 [Promethearchaeota archaeon]